MMTKLLNIFLVLGIICAFSQFSLPQNNHAPQRETGQTRGFDVVFVVDVSPGKEKDGSNKYISLVEQYVASVYDMFSNSFEINAKNNFYLVTFAEKAKLLEADKIDKDSILKEIKNHIRDKSTRIYLKQGLSKVFDLVDDSFPQKVGIVLFISSGNDSSSNMDSTKKELKRTIRSLKMNGFTVFSIFLSAGALKCRECMVMVSEWANTPFYIINENVNILEKVKNLFEKSLKIEYASPIERKTFKTKEKKWKDDYNRLQKNYGKLEEETERLKNRLKSGTPGGGPGEKYDRESTEMNEKQTTGLWLLVFILSSIIVFLLKDKLPFIRSKRNLLWGKLRFKNGSESNDDDTEIDLSNRLKGAVIKTPGKAPDFRLFICSHYGRKVMCAQVKKGCVDYYKYQNGKAYKTHQYLGSESKSIKISNLYGDLYSEYEYRFLDLLKKSFMEPAQIDLFHGREETIEKIRKNFLQERKKDCYHIFLSGIGCSGKTSLLRYLEVYFEDDEELEEKCVLRLAEYNSAENNDLNQLELDFNKTVKSLLKHKRKRRILLVDNYDDLILSTGEKFLHILYDCHTKYNIYLVLAGKIPASLIHEKYSSFLPPYYKEMILKGIRNSEKVIDSMLRKIGFPSCRLNKEIKDQIGDYSSGMPYFCKRILKEMLEIWLNNSNTYSLTKKNLEEAVRKVARDEKNYYWEQIVPHYDANDENRRDKVRFLDIMNSIAHSKGLAGKEEIENRLTFDSNEEFFNKKKKSFRIKLSQLKELGLVVEAQGCLQGIPRLFYLHKEQETHDETINRSHQG